MVEYAAGDPDNGDVFDITSLVSEMLPQASWRANIKVEVEAQYETDYSVTPPVKRIETKISFGGGAGGKYVYGASHLDDVVNSALPDGERVDLIRKREARLRKKADELNHDAMVAKLQQVAAIRSQHRIGRVTFDAALLPEGKT